jgi:hypothetical protein
MWLWLPWWRTQPFCRGEHIGLLPDGTAGLNPPFIGVVDPFLPRRVQAGETFWMFLKPGTITSLRHEWTHPAFEVTKIKPAPPDKSASEKWMRAWAMRHMSYDYYGDLEGGTLDEDSAYANAIRAGENMSVGCYEDARDHIDNEWWGHWEAITGKTGDREAYFSCAC